MTEGRLIEEYRPKNEDLRAVIMEDFFVLN